MLWRKVWNSYKVGHVVPAFLTTVVRDKGVGAGKNFAGQGRFVVNQLLLRCRGGFGIIS